MIRLTTWEEYVNSKGKVVEKPTEKIVVDTDAAKSNAPQFDNKKDGHVGKPAGYMPTKSFTQTPSLKGLADKGHQELKIKPSGEKENYKEKNPFTKGLSTKGNPIETASASNKAIEPSMHEAKITSDFAKTSEFVSKMIKQSDLATYIFSKDMLKSESLNNLLSQLLMFEETYSILTEILTDEKYGKIHRTNFNKKLITHNMNLTESVAPPITSSYNDEETDEEDKDDDFKFGDEDEDDNDEEDKDDEYGLEDSGDEDDEDDDEEDNEEDDDLSSDNTPINKYNF